MISVWLHANPTMNLRPISIALLFVYICTVSTHFTGDVSINCGSNGASAARNGRQWVGDVRPSSSLLQINGKSTTSIVTNKLASDDPVPHKTVRISRSHFSYTFRVDPGQKIIRLHFNPSSYKGFSGLKDFFSVQSGRFALLSNFSASLASAALGVNTLTKEFCLNIHENQQLTITFSPETSQNSLDTYAFINGIEIVLVPPAVSYFDGGDIGLLDLGEKSTIYVDNNTAFEIVQRRNVKQELVSSAGDSDILFPKWATQEGGKKKSSSWKVPVEVGFRYLVAERCLQDEPENRPTMAQVVIQLELALEQQERKLPLVLNEINKASAEIEESVNTGWQPTMTINDIENVTHFPEDKPNSKVVKMELPSGREVGRKSTKHKQSRFWPLGGLRNRAHTSKGNELLLSGS